MEKLVGESEKMPEWELRNCEAALRRLGEDGLGFLAVIEDSPATKQLVERRHGKKTQQQANRSVLTQFSPMLARIINNPSLKRKGYSLVLGESGDEPYEMSLLLQETKSRGPLFILNFSLFINTHNQPSVLLGNGQGYRNKKIVLFKKVMGEPPLYFLYASFKISFPGLTQLKATNVREHYYRKTGGLDRGVIAERLNEKGLLRRDEFLSYVDYIKKKSEGRINATIEKVDALVNEEIKKIVSRATGMHKVALKRLGFNVRPKIGPYRRIK